ncbi:MAG: TrbI F-type domain-containing protein [Burkholderiales bacterium]|nr:TrbI F-type domain-containing protein [Burkholderiales bacterium]
MNKLANYYSYIINVIITLIIVLISMIIIKHQMSPRIVKIDLLAITNHYTQLMMKETMNNKDQTTTNPAVQKISDAIKTNLEPTISEYAHNNNVVVVQAQALVDTSAPDITDQIINELDRKIK